MKNGLGWSLAGLTFVLLVVGCGAETPSEEEGDAGDLVDVDLTGGDADAEADAALCPAGEAPCGDDCVDTGTDVANCGGCGVICDLGEGCVGGACVLESCPAQQTLCGDACVDTRLSPDHCGTCDRACADDQGCVSGLCVKTCPTGQTLCGGVCVNTQRDAAHCGQCGVVCGVGEACVGGACACGAELRPGGDAGPVCGAEDLCCGSPLPDASAEDALQCRPELAPQCQCGGDQCAGGQLCCVDACVDPLSDPQNCGGCGLACPVGEVCVAGGCQLDCPADQTRCLDRCFDTTSNNRHCGGCGVACAEGAVCSNSVCVQSCPTGQVECDGACVDPRADRRHCGGCGLACDGGQVCADGVCSASCPGGQTLCGDVCVNLVNDDAHCGDCDRACDGLEVCSEGLCASTCASFEVACEGRCVDTALDERNCGGCGVACDASETCDAGVCRVVCPAGLLACGGQCYDADANTAHCGACDVRCGAGEVCDQGACGVICPGAQVACGGLCVDTTASAAHCGGCDRPCGGGELCANGVCVLDGGVCPSGQADCSAQGAGCVNPRTDPERCGAIVGGACDSADPASPDYQGVTCAPGEVCDEGSCLLICGAGRVACGGRCVDPLTDPEFCGAALGGACDQGAVSDPDHQGVDCTSSGAVSYCVAGACGIAQCPPGRADCDGDFATGCEADLLSDPASCGGCARACADLFGVDPGAITCAAGGCALPSGAGGCLTGRANCDGEVASGCETNTSADPLNCGGCGVTCDPGQACVAGACRCPAGQALCESPSSPGTLVCTDTSTSNAHCGACSSAASCTPGTGGCFRCASGTTCEGGACAIGCLSTQVLCDDPGNPGEQTCINPQTDPNHCGARLGGACDSATPASPDYQGAACAGGQECVGGGCACTGPADSDPALCSGQCVDLNTSEAHCGACGNACGAGTSCQPDGGGVSCQVGCAVTEVLCDGVCITPEDDPSHCGAALGGACNDASPASPDYEGEACASGFICQSGSCAAACPAGQVFCDGGCVDPNTSNQHCGAALGGACVNASPASPDYQGVTCSGGQSCTSGVCQCPAGQALCDNPSSPGASVCVDTQTSLFHCGGCGTSATCTPGTAGCTRCPSGEVCSGGACVASCGQGLVACATGCVDPQTSDRFCGASTVSCLSDPGTNCDASITSNQAVSDGVCVNSACTLLCDTNRANCDGVFANGCEANQSTSRAHCGACNNDCAAVLSNVTTSATCAGGACQVPQGTSACDAGWTNCDGVVSNGCECDISADNHRTCNASSQCVCRAGFADCDGDPTNGCEADLSQPTSCGACGNNCNNLPNVSSVGCAPSGATFACTLSSGAGACDPGFGDCDAAASNGCETNINTDLGDCGGCTTSGSPTTCTHDSATCFRCAAGTVCNNGACDASCGAGFATCPGAGCVDPLTNEDFCGASLATCSGGADCDASITSNQAVSDGVCIGGGCELLCDPGRADCDNVHANGCEANLDSDAGNCKGCGNSCAGYEGSDNIAAGGAECGPAGCRIELPTTATANYGGCQGGFADCNGDITDGCEVQVTLNTSCAGASKPGVAGWVGWCSASELVDCTALPNVNDTSCASAGCAISSCDVGWANCSGGAADGCETFTQTSLTQCGADGGAGACSGGASCDDLAPPGGVGYCIGGVCGQACPPGTSLCGGACINTQSNINQCGGCTNDCQVTVNNAIDIGCSNGACRYGTCEQLHGDCDNDPRNGCEVNHTQDVRNCLDCGNDCNAIVAPEFGVPICTVDGCDIACDTLPRPYGDCDGFLGNGCETPLFNNNENCGGCRVFCQGFCDEQGVCQL